MTTPAHLRYTPSHEWIVLENDGSATVGITYHAQDLLGDIVFLELPDPGRKLAAEEQCAVVESVKAASDIYAPVAGEVIAVNTAVVDAPDLVNKDAYANWLFKIRPDNADDISELLDAQGYQRVVDAG